MFELWISEDAGCNYFLSKRDAQLQNLIPFMSQADKEMNRWYIEKDGKMLDVNCSIHSNILNDLMTVAGM